MSNDDNLLLHCPRFKKENFFLVLNYAKNAIQGPDVLAMLDQQIIQNIHFFF